MHEESYVHHRARMIYWYVSIIDVEESKSCVSREEFDSLQQELKYWQNTTINILKKYLIDNECKLNTNLYHNYITICYWNTVREASHCPAIDDNYLKVKVEELDQKVEGILNQTQGNRVQRRLFIHLSKSIGVS